MPSNKSLVRGLVSKIRTVERQVLEAHKSGRIEQEPTITDRLLGIFEHVLNGVEIVGVRWTAKTLTDRGRGSQESVYGADFLAAFRVDLPGFAVAKGFLAQSKLVEPTALFPSSEAKRLREQCEKMLRYSTASYVFLYSQQSGILVVPAAEVLAARDCNPHELATMPMAKFYEDHFECFIGDQSIKSADPDALEYMAERYRVSKALILEGSIDVYDTE